MWPTAPSCHCQVKAAQQPQPPRYTKLRVWPQPGEELHQKECGEAGSSFCFALYSVFSPFITFILPLTFSYCFPPPLPLIMNPPLVPTTVSGFSLCHLNLPTLMQAVLSLRQGSSAAHQDWPSISALHFPPQLFPPQSPESSSYLGGVRFGNCQQMSMVAEDSFWLDQWSKVLWMPEL